MSKRVAKIVEPFTVGGSASDAYGMPADGVLLFRHGVVDGEKALTWGSSGFCALFGLNADHFPIPLANWISTSIHPEDQAGEETRFSEPDGPAWEFRIRAKDDSDADWTVMRQELLLAQAREQEDAAVVDNLYKLTDVTEYHRRLAELRTAKDELEQTVALNNIEIVQTSLQYLELIDSSAQGIFVHDGDMIGYANNALAKILGLGSAKDVIRKEKIWNLFPEDEVQRLKEYRDGRPDGDKSTPETYQCRMLRKDGSTIWAEIHVSMPRWKGGMGYLGLVTDISERRASEEAMRAARRHAERANRLKSDFLAKMSHELRTPLNAIIGFSQTLGVQNLDALTQDKLKEYTGYIQDGAEHLLHIVNEILDLSKIEAGRFELEEGPVSLRDVVLRAREMVAGLAESRSVSVVVEGLDDGEVKIFADERAMLQIVLNLLSNAVKYGNSDAQVTISVIDPDEAAGITIQVTDSGNGIPKERMDYILTPFGRLGNSDAYQSGGTGLGLPIVKSLVELHKGTLAIDSVVGEGTTVIVRLPTDKRLP